MYFVGHFDDWFVDRLLRHGNPYLVPLYFRQGVCLGDGDLLDAAMMPQSVCAVDDFHLLDGFRFLKWQPVIQ